MDYSKKDFKLTRTLTPFDKRRLQLMMTAAGQRNNKMSKQRISEYLADSYQDVMGFGGWQSWWDFIGAVLDRPNTTTTHPAIYIELLGGVLFRETCGTDGPSNR